MFYSYEINNVKLTYTSQFRVSGDIRTGKSSSFRILILAYGSKFAKTSARQNNDNDIIKNDTLPIYFFLSNQE